MNKKNLINDQITFYIRTAKKLGFLSKSKKKMVSQKELKQIAEQKSKIPVQKQILYYNGQQIKQNSEVKLVNNSIVHVLDSRNIGKSKTRLLVRRLQQNYRVDSFEVQSDSSISQFIQKKLSQFYEEPADKLFFVYTGRQLKKQKSFRQQHIESQTQIYCVHEDKDKKKQQQIIRPDKQDKTVKNQNIKLKQDNNFQLKTQRKNDQLKIQSQEVEKKEKKMRQSEYYSKGLEQKKEQEQKKDLNKSELYCQQVKNERDSKENITENEIKEQERIQNKEKVGNQIKKQKKLIKSIEEIKCMEYQSDQDSDNQNHQAQIYSIPKKLPQDYLPQQTTNNKNSKENNSQSSSISQPNFKKKKKVSQIQVADHNQQKDQKVQVKNRMRSQSNQKTIYNSSFNEKEIQNRNKKSQSDIQNLKKNLRTKDQIFYNDLHTYTSVIDQPQQDCQRSNAKTKPNNNKKCLQNNQQIFNSYIPYQEQEIYDSQMNSQYYRTDEQKPEVRYNKGFLNFSNASFLQTSKMQNCSLNTNKCQQQPVQKMETQKEKKSQIKSQQKYSTNSRSQQNLINKNLELLTNSYLPSNDNDSEQLKNKYGHNHIIECQNDSLSFSKNPESNIHNDDNQQDNLFVQYRRGIQNHQINSIIRQEEKQEISESNLLSETYQNPNLTDHMNSITFNLQPNPDQITLTIRQNLVQIIPQEEIEQQNQEYQQGKRESQIETNFKDSAAPSQINSNPSQMNGIQIGSGDAQQQIDYQPFSLIDDLISGLDIKININEVQSMNSESQEDRKQQDQDTEIKEHFEAEHIKQESLQKESKESKKQQVEEPSSSNVFVSYQSYRVDNSIETFQISPSRNQFNNISESNLLDQNALNQNKCTTEDKQSYKNNIIDDTEANQLQFFQNSAIKIEELQQNFVEQDSALKQKNILQSNIFQNESVQCSGVFHQISQSGHQKLESNINLANNVQAYDITFRKDNNLCQSKIQDLRSSHLLIQLSNQAQAQQEPKLLPGDYIYSTDKVQEPDQVLDHIIQGFTHCF